MPGIADHLVLLDTSVFVAAGFNTASRDLRILATLSHHGIVALIITDIIYHETYNQIREKAKAACGKHAKFRTSSDTAILRSAETSQYILAEIDSEEVAKEVGAAFQAFVERAGVFIVPTVLIPCGDVVMDYLCGRAPFQGGKPEFPDAFSLKGALNWMTSTATKRMSFVTGDKNLGEAAAAHEGVRHHFTLQSLLDEINSEDEARASFLKREIINRRDELKKWAAEVFSDRGFDVEDRFEGEVIEATASQIDISDDEEFFDIVELKESSATVVTRVDVEFSADIKYGDDNSASHDKELGTTYWNYIEETVNDRREMEFEVKVTFKGLDPDHFKLEAIDFNEPDPIFVETSQAAEWRDIK